MHRHLVAALICTTLISPAALAGEQSPPKLEPILARYVDAVGGSEPLERLEFRSISGRQIDDRPYRGPVEVEPLVFRFTEPDLKNRKRAFLLDPRGPLMLEEYFPGLRPEGTRMVDGRLKYVVGSDLEPAYHELVFDAETGLLTGIGYYWILSDYREVDGILFPYRVTMSRKGGITTWEFETVTHNADP